MSVSVRHPGPASKYAMERGTYHVSHCKAMATAMWGYAATVARLTGIPERMLQHYMSPQGEKEGPFEKGARIVRVLRELGAPAWCEPVRVLADEFGFDLAARPDAEPCHLPSSVLEAVGEMGDLARATECAFKDGRVTTSEAERIEREGLELIEVVHRLIRQARVNAEAGAKPRRIEVGR